MVNYLLFRSLLLNLFADTGIFGLDVTNDLEHASSNSILYIYQPALTYDKNTYKAEGKTEKILMQYYMDYQTNVRVVLGCFCLNW